MPNDYKLTHAAKHDLKEIWRYTFERWGEQQAEKYVLQFEKRFNDLVNTPYLGRSRPDIQKDYRSFSEGKHIIFYRVTGAIIEIIGIPHVSMDVKSHLLRQQSDK